MGMTTLAYAASFGNSKVRVLSKSSGVDPNVGSRPRLACAAEGGHVHVVEMLLAIEGSDVIKNRSEKVVKLLLETQEIDVKYKIGEDGQTALRLALPIIVSQESIEVVKIHLETPGIDLNIKNSVGESIWFPAVRRDSKSISMDISNASKVNTGCVDDETGETLDLNAENDEGDSVIHSATRQSYLKVIGIFTRGRAWFCEQTCRRE